MWHNTRFSGGIVPGQADRRGLACHTPGWAVECPGSRVRGTVPGSVASYTPVPGASLQSRWFKGAGGGSFPALALLSRASLSQIGRGERPPHASIARIRRGGASRARRELVRQRCAAVRTQCEQPQGFCSGLVR